MSKIECSVCCAEVKNAISCLACKYISCIACAQQFLLSTHNARCMNCSHAWDELFIRNTFPKSWVEKQYKDHRKASLIDIEKSYLAESMPYVEQYKQMKAYETAAVELEEKTKDYIMDLQKQLETLTISLREPSIFKKRTIEAVNKKIKIKQQIQDVTNEVRNSKGNIINAKARTQRSKGLLHDSIRGFSSSSKQESKIYNTPCIDKTCRGFLSSDWMCGLCSKQVCKHCREDITGKKETHTCDPNIVANIKAMYEDAVPCPKCKEPISRISGCNHMFCTWCHTGFDYKTGLIIDAKHNTNPHFYRWQAQQQAAQAQLPRVAPRVAAQRPRTDVCATPAHTAYLIDEKIRSIYGNECYKYYRNALHLFCNNITSLIGECQGRIVQPYGPEHNRMSRIKYLAGLQSEKELARDAMKEYKRVRYDVECIQLKQMLSTTLTDWLRTFAQFVDTECNSDTNLFKEPILNIPNELVAYYNCEALKLAKAFDYSCYQEASIRLYMYRRERSKIKDPYIEVIMLNDCKTKVLVTSIPSSKFNSNECKASGWTITTKPI